MRQGIKTVLLLTGWMLTNDTVKLQAHESPEHEIESLTREIKTQGVSAERLFRRALEYRSLRKHHLYEHDLDAALKLNPNFVPVRIELAKWKLQQQESSAARALIEPITSDEDRVIRAVAIAMRAKTEMIDKNWDRAIADFTTALKTRPDIELFLQRAESQHHAKNWDELLAGLRDGYSRTESPILLRELCDRLLEVQDESMNVNRQSCHREAMEIIEHELNGSRFQSSWLTRRARLRLTQKDRTGAATDLTAAIAEIQDRMSGNHPDPQLVAEIQAAKELLNQIRD